MGAERAEPQKTKLSDPDVLKQCAQRPQEVHLKTCSHCLKVCLKTAGRLYFFYELSFFSISPFNNL